MATTIANPAAKTVTTQLAKSGWKVSCDELPALMPHGQRVSNDHNPGLRMTASKPNRAITYTVDVRDWSRERRELEAALLLKRTLQNAKSKPAAK